MITPDEYSKFDLTSSIEEDDTLLSSNKIMKENFSFLTSNRFWALVIGAVAMYLQAKGIIGQPEMVLIATITSGFIVVKTVDRNTGDAVKAGGMTTVSIPNNVSTVTASTEGSGNTGTNY